MSGESTEEVEKRIDKLYMELKLDGGEVLSNFDGSGGLSVGVRRYVERGMICYEIVKGYI